MGSPAISTGLDGLSSYGLALGRTSLGVDPLNQLSLSVQDAFGRLSVVAETEVTENSFTTGTFSSTNWWLSPTYATTTTLNGQSVLRVGKSSAGGSTNAATVNQTFFGGKNSFFFRFQLSGNNHDSRIMAKATDGSGAYVSLELRNGKIYPGYHSSAGSGTVTEIQIDQVSNAWYRAQLSLNDVGQPTWRVWREDGIGDPDKQFTYTLVNQSINTLLLSKTWQFTLAPGTNGAGTAYFYLGAYQQGKYNLTRYAYDKANNLSTVTDAAGNVTTLTYDKLGRKLTMNDPDMGTWSYAYDLAGNLIRQTDAKYQRLCFTYDLQNRLLNKKDDGFYSGSGADNCSGGGTTLASYTYHGSGMGRGQVATIEGTNNGVTFNDSFSYDYQGRVSSTSRTIAGTLYTLSTTYDLMDRPITLTYPGGEVVTTDYDKQVVNSLTTSSGPTTLVSNVTYNHRLDMTGVVLNNGLTQEYAYYPASDNYRLQFSTLKVTATGYANFFKSYQYDDVGNITLWRTSLIGHSDEYQYFSYDSLGRLKTAKAVGGPAQYDHSSASTDYDYDAIGNLVNMAGTPLGYQDSAHKHAATHRNGSQAFTYDNNGNMVTRIEGSTTYTQAFDVENRLKTVSLTVAAALVTNFAYDASGQRLRTEVAPSGSPAANDTRTFTTYPFPGYEVEQTDTWQYLCADKGGTNCSWQWGHTSTVTRKTYFLGGQAVATRVESIPAQGGDGFYYLHSDHLGSSSLLTNSSGVKVTGSETRYYPYGAQRLAPTMPADNITDRDFTGQKENSYIKLIYYNARWYDSQIGHFVSADTIVPQASNPQSYNRYSYVLGNPIKYTDPTGHFCYDGTTNEFSDGTCFDAEQQALTDHLIWIIGLGFNDLDIAQSMLNAALGLISDPVAALRAVTEIFRPGIDVPGPWGFEFDKSSFYYEGTLAERGISWTFDDTGFGDLTDPASANQISHFIGIAYISAYEHRMAEINPFMTKGDATLNMDVLVRAHEAQHLTTQSAKKTLVEIDLGMIGVELGRDLVVNKAPYIPGPSYVQSRPEVSAAISAIESYVYSDEHPLQNWLDSR
jgi:RHS repeat-associated protein